MLQLIATFTLAAVAVPLAVEGRARRRAPISAPSDHDEYERLAGSAAAARTAADALDGTLDVLDDGLARLRRALPRPAPEVVRASAA